MTDKVVAFEIDGKQYEWPGLMALSVRECRIFYEETGIVWEALWLNGMTVNDLFMREGFLSAMARIAYVREHPEALEDDVKTVISNQPRMSLFSTLLEAFNDTPDASEDPKARSDESTSSSPTRNEPGSTPNGANKKPETSGKDSERSSDEQVSDRANTGTGESDGRYTSPPSETGDLTPMDLMAAVSIWEAQHQPA